MEKNYNFKETEKRIYEMWEKGGYFTPKVAKSKKPFTVVLPPPNASGKMHTGNVLMIAIEDILIRWSRMKGIPALWIPGTDHAGTETQITFERELKKEGKSRFDYDRNTLYQKIWDFVETNKGLVDAQIRRMGASVDWGRYKFTLDEDVVKTVCETFKKMHGDGLVYRDDYIVNYCPACGTTYADIEVEYKERNDPLYFMKYGPFVIATVRPESKFRDTALAVNPADKRYKGWLGKTVKVLGLLGEFEMTVIPDPEVNPKFGTGIMKVTPAHDPHDFELGKKFNLPVTPIIDLNGRMDFTWFFEKEGVEEKYLERAKKYHRKKVLEARKLMVEDLKEDGLLVKVDETYMHSVPVCKAGHDIEPTILPNWFIKVEPLKKAAHDVVKEGKVKIYPKWREVTYHRWMEGMHDWAISRQNVWGIRIPVWYNVDENPDLELFFLDPVSNERVISKVKYILKGFSGTASASEVLKVYLPDARVFVGSTSHRFELGEIRDRVQQIRAPLGSKFVISNECPGERYLQETDTFDTWFSSGQWPLVTLGYPDSADFKYFYPTSVLEAGWDILTKWVSRMIMFGLYLTGKPPFESVYLHGIVRALDGRKMSKSLGNVINPEEYIEEFGVDALRMGLISGTATGRDFNFPRDKVIAYRNFSNKLWNIGRFALLAIEENGVILAAVEKIDSKKLREEDKVVLKKLAALIKGVDRDLEKFRFAQAGELLYHFVWHELADKYVESIKDRQDKEVCLSVLAHVFSTSLKLLHPFMPFVTEEVWQKMPGGEEGPLITAPWPVV